MDEGALEPASLAWLQLLKGAAPDRYCPRCASTGFVSVVQQLAFFSRCLLHHTSLASLPAAVNAQKQDARRQRAHRTALRAGPLQALDATPPGQPRVAVARATASAAAPSAAPAPEASPALRQHAPWRAWLGRLPSDNTCAQADQWLHEAQSPSERDERYAALVRWLLAPDKPEAAAGVFAPLQAGYRLIQLGARRAPRRVSRPGRWRDAGECPNRLDLGYARVLRRLERGRLATHARCLVCEWESATLIDGCFIPHKAGCGLAQAFLLWRLSMENGASLDRDEALLLRGGAPRWSVPLSGCWQGDEVLWRAAALGTFFGCCDTILRWQQQLLGTASDGMDGSNMPPEAARMLTELRFSGGRGFPAVTSLRSPDDYARLKRPRLLCVPSAWSARLLELGCPRTPSA